MRKLALILGVLTLFAFAAFAYGQQDDSGDDSGYSMGPGMMDSYGPGYGGGYGGGYGPGMMRGYGGGYGPGYGGGYGRGYGGPGYGRTSSWQNPDCKQFLDDTVQMRKQLHDKRFEYAEAARNPKTTVAQLAKIEKEIRDLQKQIYQKAPISCR